MNVLLISVKSQGFLALHVSIVPEFQFVLAECLMNCVEAAHLVVATRRTCKKLFFFIRKQNGGTYCKLKQNQFIFFSLIIDQDVKYRADKTDFHSAFPNLTRHNLRRTFSFVCV